MPSLPEIGDGFTHQLGSDRYPYTVIGTEGTTIVVQADQAILDVEASGPQPSENQVYTFERNPDGQVVILKRKVDSNGNSSWKTSRAGNRGGVWYAGRTAYRDPHF